MEDIKNTQTTENQETITTGAEQQQDVPATEKTYTEAELRDFLQRETDRRVTAALKKQQQTFETKMAEADKLRGMDETQRKEYEYNQKVAELEQREKEFNLMQNKVEASKVLSNRGLPVEFVDYIVAEDADTMMDNITTFEKAFKAAVADAVTKQLASPSPKTGTVTQTGLTKDDFKKMTLAQQSELYKTNPALYKELTQR